MESKELSRNDLRTFYLTLLSGIVVAIIIIILGIVEKIDIQIWVIVILIIFFIMSIVWQIQLILSNRALRKLLTDPFDIGKFLADEIKSPLTVKSRDIELMDYPIRTPVKLPQKSEIEILTYSKDHYCMLFYDDAFFQENLKLSKNFRKTILFEDCLVGFSKLSVTTTDSDFYYVELLRSKGQTPPDKITESMEGATFDLSSNNQLKNNNKKVIVKVIIKLKAKE